VSGSLYFAALLGALVICVAGGLMAHRPRRRCLQCNQRILQSARRCPHCGYEIER
jgi:predicted amidophosphoribosyltransferase